MNPHVTIDFPDQRRLIRTLDNYVLKLVERITVQDKRELGRLAAREIKDRTIREGRDFEDEPFRPYSWDYQLEKAHATARKTRRKRKSDGKVITRYTVGSFNNLRQGIGGGLHVNMVGFGRRNGGLMMAHMRGGVRNSMAAVYFASAESGRIANYHNSWSPRSKMPFRRFLDVDRHSRLHGTLAQFLISRIVENAKRPNPGRTSNRAVPSGTFTMGAEGGPQSTYGVVT